MDNLKRIQELEKVSRELEPSQSQRQAMSAKVYEYCDQLLEELPDAKCFEFQEDCGFALCDDPINEKPSEIEKLIESFDQNVANNGVRCNSGKYFGYIPSGGIYTAALGDYMAAVSNQYAGYFPGFPGAALMENMLVKWVCEIIGYPEEAHGTLTSGGSLANLTAMVAARDAGQVKSGYVTKTSVYLTDQAHHCVEKDFEIIGLGEINKRYVRVDEHYRMDTAHLQELIEEDIRNGYRPWMVVATAGTTNLGAVDPLERIATIAKRYELWFHVDAAVGGFFILAESCKQQLEAMKEADSIVLDPHKSLFLPYGTGMVITKRKKYLLNSFKRSASYLEDIFNYPDEPSPADLSPELTRHFRGMRVWLPLKLHGLKPFKACLEEKIQLTHYAYQKISEIDGIEMGPSPDLCIFCFRLDSNKATKELLKTINLDGEIFMTPTTIDDKFYIRFVVLSFRTHLEQVDRALEIIQANIKNQRLAKIEA